MLQDDLKDYRAEDDPFVLFTPDECAIGGGILLAVALLLDALQRIAA